MSTWYTPTTSPVIPPVSPLQTITSIQLNGHLTMSAGDMNQYYLVTSSTTVQTITLPSGQPAGTWICLRANGGAGFTILSVVVNLQNTVSFVVSSTGVWTRK